MTRGPYLQLTTPNSTTIRWRTDLLAESVVRYGFDPSDLALSVSDPTLRTEHEILLPGLSPGTRYYYSIGTSGLTFAGGNQEHRFWTHPITGIRRPVRIWAIGDAGGANQTTRDIRDAYLSDTLARTTDVLLMLGDNAYVHGTDLEYQAAVFETFPSLPRQTAAWPSFGNHDAVSANSATQTGPYYDSFTLPTAGEAGGVASNTEAYYSFDFGNVHFVALDSSESDRSPGGEMLSWLTADLTVNQQD
ncbi:MAG: metallophosphoesterase family protein [bacterium]|nr:metallophosphoesterase family protein [bacterium]